MNYCDKKRLAVLFRDWQATGTLSPELMLILTHIAHGLYARFHFNIGKDEYTQEIMLLFCQKYKGVDTTKNIYGWLTSVAFNHFRQLWRQNQREDIKRKKYYKKLTGED